MIADRHGCITAFEEAPLRMMIKSNGMSEEKCYSILPEARGISVRRLRNLMRHSELLTKSTSGILFGSASTLNTLFFLSKCLNVSSLERIQYNSHELQAQFWRSMDYGSKCDIASSYSPLEKVTYLSWTLSQMTGLQWKPSLTLAVGFPEHPASVSHCNCFYQSGAAI